MGRSNRRIMKFFAVFALLLVLGMVAAEETKAEDSQDILKLDYHVCTRRHLLKILHRYKHLRHYLHHIKHLRHHLRVLYKRIHIYKVRYHHCRRNCYWSCKRIINYWSRRRRGDEEE